MRELVRRIQDQRKGAGLHVADRIRVVVQASERLAAAIHEHEAYLRAETLSVSLESRGEPPGGAVEHSFDGERAWVSIEKAAES